MNILSKFIFSSGSLKAKYLFRLFYVVKSIIFYKPFIKALGQNSIIVKPLKIEGKKNISIGASVTIEAYTWLAALPLTNNACTLQIHDGVSIGHFNHIYATHSIVIEKGVLTADKVYISDNLHEYTDITKHIKNQPIKQLKEVRIGEGSWIGENVCIIGCSIGQQCVIGANAVVTKDIPPYSVAVGNPARVIKCYDFETKQWCRAEI